jgi:hypothetical protein
MLQKLKLTLFIIVLTCGKAFPQITDLKNLKGHTEKIFTSGSGKEYKVKWKDSNDGFPDDPDPVNHHAHGGTHGSGHTCPSLTGTGDNDLYNNKPSFDGEARCEAKTNFSASAEDEITLSELSKKFKDFIVNGTFDDVTSDDKRTDKEDKNFTIKNVRIYAIKREKDEDYHMIIGPRTNADQGKLINVEISGLPKRSAASFATLKKVRTDLITELTGIEKLTGKKWGTYLFFPEGIPVNITGSLFYDVDHKGSHVGPGGLHSPTCMELHPVTDIEFIGQ